MTPLAADESFFAGTSEKPTVLFIPGAFHTAAHFGPLSRYLETQGCESFAIRLPSTGEKAGTSAGRLAEDVAAIRRVLEELVWDEDGGDGKGGGDDDEEGNNNHDDDPKSGEGGIKDEKSPPSSSNQNHELINRDPGQKNIILVMHSTGAVAGCQAITKLERSFRKKKGKKGGVIGLFFVGGLLVDEGESLESTILNMGEQALPGYAEAEGAMLRPYNAGARGYSDLPPEKAAYWESKLEPQSASVYSTAVQKTRWDMKMPVTYVACTKDPGARVAGAMVAKKKKAVWTIKTIESGNFPFLSCVVELGDMILRAGRMGQGHRTE